MEEKIYLAILHSLWFTQKKLHFIFKNIQNYKEVYENISEKYLSDLWFKIDKIKIILERNKKIKISYFQNIIEKRWVEIITVYDDNFPEELHQLSNVPFVFYLRWKYPKWQKLSIVGSRKITSYWEKIIENFIPEIWKYFTIVSWGAAWCDTKAHKVSLGNNINTFSIIWTGIDQDYPTNNKKLYDDIILKWWGVMSIFPILEVWNPYNFPIRNEIVACISVWTLIVEAKEKSWTLITARLVLEYGRDLFAVPWDIFLQSSWGANLLIQNWSAFPTLCWKDILEQFNIISQNEKKIWIWNISQHSFQDDLEEKIYNLLLTEKLNINQIAQKLESDVITLGFKMSMLEISGLIKKSLSGEYEIQ